MAQTVANLTITSDAFREGERIPAKYTCEGRDVSPALTWTKPPDRTQSLALIVDDPDAPGGVFTHWVLFNLPGDATGLSEAVPALERLPNSTRQGRNDFGKTGYGGPCPPKGPPHHYRFTLYALDKMLDLPSRVAKKQLLDTMPGHVLGQGQLTGLYQR